MNWYIGQDIVCIKKHSQSVIKKGDVFVIKGLQQSCCQILINISIAGNMGSGRTCIYCNFKSKNDTLIWWFGEALFVPLESIADISEIQELLKQPVYQ